MTNYKYYIHFFLASGGYTIMTLTRKSSPNYNKFPKVFTLGFAQIRNFKCMMVSRVKFSLEY